jgi:hypothetical protein
MESGGNVYADTDRYNYGPLWLLVIAGASKLAQLTADPFPAFRMLLSCLLTLADLGICLLLRRRGGDLVAALFFLNPVSVIISGYHRQFGNLALLAGLLAAEAFDRDPPERLGAHGWLGIAALGLSLTTKHLLFAFPWWMAVKKRRPAHKLVVLAVPGLLFAVSFLPFWAGGHEGIIDHVFQYRSIDNQPLWNGVLPPLLAKMVPAMAGLLAALTVGGLLARRLPAFHSLLLYTAVLVVFSPSLANQYLALAMPFVVFFANPFGVVFTVAATLLLLQSSDGLGLFHWLSDNWLYTWGFAILVALLLATLLWPLRGSSWSARRSELRAWMRRELEYLMGRGGAD